MLEGPLGWPRDAPPLWVQLILESSACSRGTCGGSRVAGRPWECYRGSDSDAPLNFQPVELQQFFDRNVR